MVRVRGVTEGCHTIAPLKLVNCLAFEERENNVVLQRGIRRNKYEMKV